MSDNPTFWFNTKTKLVEQGPKSLSMNRIGPFESYEEALRAEAIITARAAKLRSEDSKRDTWTED